MAKDWDNKPLNEWDLDSALFHVARLRPVKRIKVSPEYAAFLENELDSDAYARSLVSTCRTQIKSPAMTPDHLDAIPTESLPVGSFEVRPTTLEYRRFLNHEISSREYAIALATCARLEAHFCSPAKAPSKPHRAMSWNKKRRLLLRHGVSLVTLPLLSILVILIPLGIKSGLDFVPMARDLSGSVIGALLLVITVIASWSSTLRGWVNSALAYSDDQSAS